MKELAGGSPAQVHGTMRVLSEFCQDVSDTQLPHIAPIILPQLVQVIMQAEVSKMAGRLFFSHPRVPKPFRQMYSVRTRSRAVHIFSVLAGLCYAMSETFTVRNIASTTPCISSNGHSFTVVVAPLP